MIPELINFYLFKYMYLRTFFIKDFFSYSPMFKEVLFLLCSSMYFKFTI